MPPPFPLGTTCSVTCNLNLESFPFLSPALPWVGTKDLEMSDLTLSPRMPLDLLHPLLRKCGNSCAYLPLGNQFQTDQIFSRCPNPPRLYSPQKVALGPLHTQSMAPTPNWSPFEHSHSFAWGLPPTLGGRWLSFLFTTKDFLLGTHVRCLVSNCRVNEGNPIGLHHGLHSILSSPFKIYEICQTAHSY